MLDQVSHRLKIAQKIPFLKDLSAGQVNRVIQSGKIGSVDAGNQLCKAGDHSNAMWILLGGQLSIQDGETVLAAALEKRGLAWMRDGATESLRIALDAWATPSQIQEFMGPLTEMVPVVWLTSLEAETEVDESRIKIFAIEDGDDYVIDGQGLFEGISFKPDLLWILVRLRTASEPVDPGLGSMCSCLIPTTRGGIVYPRSRNLISGGPRAVIFNQVRVPRYLMLGPPGAGAKVMQTATAAAKRRLEPYAGNTEAAWLQRFLLDTVDACADLDQQEILQQVVMDSYIDSRVSRLFRMRDAWMRAAWTRGGGEPTTYQPTQTRLWEGRAAMRLADTARQVLGPYTLLDHQDPRAPAEGRFELHQRRSLDQTSSGSHWLVDQNTIARQLGLVKQTNSPVTAGAPEPG